MARGPEVAVFGAGPAAVFTAQELRKADCGVTMIHPDSQPPYRSIYSTSFGAPELENLPPGLTRDLTEMRIIAPGVDVSIPIQEHRYFVVDYPRLIQVSLNSLENDSSLRQESLPAGVITKVVLADLKSGVLLRVDGEEETFDLAVDCTGINAEILKQVEPKRRRENFLAEYVYGGKYPGYLEREQMILVFGAGGGTSWVCPSIEPGFIDVVFSAWGPSDCFEPKFLPGANKKLAALLGEVKNQAGIYLERLNPEEIFCGMIRSQRILPPDNNHVYGVGESMGMASPLSGDSFKKLPNAARLLAKSISLSESPRKFYQRWRKESGANGFLSGDDFFLASALMRLPHQQTGKIGGLTRRILEVYSCQGQIADEIKKGVEDWMIRNQVNPQVLRSLLKDPAARRFISGSLIKRMEILIKGADKIKPTYTLPEIL